MHRPKTLPSFFKRLRLHLLGVDVSPEPVPAGTPTTSLRSCWSTTVKVVTTFRRNAFVRI